MLPAYISDTGHGAASHQAPLLLSNVECYLFTLKADTELLQGFIDDQLNRVSDGAVRYRALPWVLNCWFHSEKGTSLAEAGGYMPSKECQFVVPLLEFQRDGSPLPKLKAWIPYLFIDQQDALITAREVWGYRKSLGTVEIPSGPDAPARFSTTATVFPVLDRSREGEVLELVKLTGNGVRGPLEATLKDIGNGFKHLIERFAGIGEAEWSKFSQHIVEGLYDLSPSFIFPLINLKQFRDVVDSSRACYQALVDCPSTLDKLHGGGTLHGDYTMEIPYVQSHTIVKDLGLVTNGPVADPSADNPSPVTTIKPVFGQWLNMDLVVSQGNIIWESTARRD